ncbi:MAG: PH domain-containing protein [Pseudorhodobacter sp.]|nr:PH domain-containing protein [Frankiaceae bacterium]
MTAAWSRLHPLSPVVKGGRAVLVLAFVTLPRQLLSQHVESAQLAVDAAVALLIVLAGVVSWLTSRWRLDGTELQLELGLVRRQSLRVPLTRVQAVDVVRPLAARLLGLSELRLVMAGSGTGQSRLAYLPHSRALAVRGQLLELGSTGPSAAVPQEVLLQRVDDGALIASALLGGPAVTLAVSLLVLGVLAVVAPDQVGPVLGGGATVVLGAATAVTRRLNVELRFRVALAPDGLRLSSGLLQTRVETVPAGRVQAVRLLEPLLWRPFRWVRLEVDVAQQREREVGQDDVAQLTRALMPVGSRSQAQALLDVVLPGASLVAASRPPRRARWRAPLSFSRLAFAVDDRFLVARTGVLEVTTVVVPLGKAQSLRMTQGPVQRRLRLASIEVDTAGRRWRASALHRDEGEAAELLAELTERSRAAR